MPHAFEVRKEIEFKASPEEVWEAIATGAGMDGWYLGTGNMVEPRLDGGVRVSFGSEDDEGGTATVTAWDPPTHFAYRGDAHPDGSLHALEYIVEGRAGGMTLVRLVHSGFLVDDWESEYDALNEGDFMYLHQMAQYVTYFRGRSAKILTAWRPDTDRERGFATLHAAMGVSDSPKEGDAVHFSADGIPAIDGVVDFVSPNLLGFRASDALYRFQIAPGFAYAGHHVFRNDVDVDAETAAWQAWLDRSFT
jgi:uncharacterized protein YndB with AHSA1/START domain